MPWVEKDFPAEQLSPHFRKGIRDTKSIQKKKKKWQKSFYKENSEIAYHHL